MTLTDQSNKLLTALLLEKTIPNYNKTLKQMFQEKLVQLKKNFVYAYNDIKAVVETYYLQNSLKMFRIFPPTPKIDLRIEKKNNPLI